MLDKNTNSLSGGLTRKDVLDSVSEVFQDVRRNNLNSNSAKFYIDLDSSMRFGNDFKGPVINKKLAEKVSGRMKK